DGMRDFHVTGVQTCALPILWEGRARTIAHDGRRVKVKPALRRQTIERIAADARHRVEWLMSYPDAPRGNRRSIIVDIAPATGGRSEERRGGKGTRCARELHP